MHRAPPAWPVWPIAESPTTDQFLQVFCTLKGVVCVQVLDLKRFQPGQELLPGLLWVAEQIPGLIEAADMTETLLRGYWPSYNVPFFPEASALRL